MATTLQSLLQKKAIAKSIRKKHNLSLDSENPNGWDVNYALSTQNSFN